MLMSMTGYGQGKAENQEMGLIIDLKSVNNRYLDLNIRMPRKFNPFEDLVRERIKASLVRGKVDVFINIENSHREDLTVTADFPLLRRYVEAYEAIKETFGLEDKISLNHLVRIPEALMVEDRGLDEEAVKSLLLEALDRALTQMSAMRRTEGEKLALDILDKTDKMNHVLQEIELLAPFIASRHQEKMAARIQELLGQVEDFDADKLNMEIAVFADRKDINEEIVRLKSHFAQIDSLIKTQEVVGRKLDFLLQEVNREVNTIGSKSPDYDISNHVVELKSLLEKIREQVQNIE
ncbi:MAG: hypothetical protein AVO33_02785 [delta proteobacterium ML8_F1]|nr:MAG: hypothetical protein AVO33_02785 [delta proteobacterium ML8_F1]